MGVKLSRRCCGCWGTGPTAYDPKLSSAMRLPLRCRNLLQRCVQTSDTLLASAQIGGGRVRRRAFITIVGGVSLTWPLAAHAQQSRKIVGVLQAQGPSNPPIPVLRSFLKRLRELGWIEGKNLGVEFRGAPTVDGMTELAADFVRMNVDVIFAAAIPHVEAARRVTKTIPIVFATHGDPVGAGHVASLGRPSGNVTGLSNLTTELTAKGLQVLKEALPSATSLALFGRQTTHLPRQQ
jgi:putative tryptophan/tyrosine transport system substrate-binding protein